MALDDLDSATQTRLALRSQRSVYMPLPRACWIKAVRYQAGMTPGPLDSIFFTPGFSFLDFFFFCMLQLTKYWTTFP